MTEKPETHQEESTTETCNSNFYCFPFFNNFIVAFIFMNITKPHKIDGALHLRTYMFLMIIKTAINL